jgi:hypothetical protein
VPLWLRRSERSWLGLRLSHHAHCKRSSAGLNRNPSQDAPPSLPLHLPLLTPHVHHACCCCCCFCTIGGRTHRGPHRHAQQRIDTDGFWQRHHSHGLHCRSLQSPDTVMPRPEAEQQSSSPTGQTERLMPLWALSTAAPPPAPSTDPSPLVTIATATNIDTTTADTSDTNVAVLDEDTFEALGVPIDGTLARHSIRYSIILRRQRGQPSTNSLTSTVECALAHVAIRPALVVLSHSRLRRSHGYGSTRDDPRCHAAGPFHRDC